MKKIIIILIITLVVLISAVICILILYNNSNIWKDENLIEQEEMYANGINNPGLSIDGEIPQKVKIDNIFFTVEGCIKNYIEYAVKSDSKAILALLDYKFEQSNNINEGNVNNYFITNVTGNTNKTKEMYGITRA